MSAPSLSPESALRQAVARLEAAVARLQVARRTYLDDLQARYNTHLK